MSNHIDPKMQEIIRNHENAQRGLEKFDNPFITQEHQDRAYLLSEYRRLQGEREFVKEALDSVQTYMAQEKYMSAEDELERIVAYLKEDAEEKLSECNRLQIAATSVAEILERIKQREMDAYKYETDVYLDAAAALSHLKGE